ncbi:MAG: hypothetical protein FD159_479 [Syntrophaceae bacterium]|nr:MAG: hypothetical protein FD159_479 [Syntrophaceae bacterium]
MIGGRFFVYKGINIKGSIILEQGYREFMPNPFLLKALSAKIREVLDSPSTISENIYGFPMKILLFSRAIQFYF